MHPLLQAATEPAQVENTRSLFFEHLPAGWVIGLIIVPVLVAVAFLAYRHPKRDRLGRRVLAGIRLGLLALAVVLAMGPYFRETEQKSEPAPLALLIDDSASVQHRDVLEPEVLRALQANGLSAIEKPARLELVQALLASPWRTTLEERYQVKAYRFADRLAPTATDGTRLTGQGPVTAIGDGLLSLLAENRGRRLPDVVLVTDGRNNHGTLPAEAAARLSAEGVRVHALALGDPRPAPDLSLERVRVPELVLSGDDAVFALRVRATGQGIPSRVRVRLSDELGRTLDETIVETAGGAGTQVSLQTRMYDPGTRTLVADVEVVPGETAQENNKLDLSLEVKEVKIRVLYVEGYPRWEYRYLKNRLTRAPFTGGDIETRCWLANASRDFAQERTPGLTPLRRIPSSVDELLRDYDVVVLGDTDPSDLDPDPLAGMRFLDDVAEFVRRGGGLLVLAGPRNSPESLIGSPIEPLLPVVLGRESAYEPQPFHPMPVDKEAPHPVTVLSPDVDENWTQWEENEPLWWYWPVERLRPGAQAWLVHPLDDNDHGQMVIAAGSYVPEGWVGWIGTDETWRWRFPGGELYVEKFWRSVIRNLAAARLRGDQGRARLEVDRSRIEIGESLTIEARLRDEAYQPLMVSEGVEVFVEDRERPVHLDPVPGSPGLYRGLLRPARTGPHLLTLNDGNDRDGDVLASARFSAVLPSIERRQPAQDPETLRELTERTGGSLVGIHEADKLLDTLDGRDRLSRTLASRDLPLDNTGFLIAFLVLACAEWLLRKRLNLS